MILIYQAQDLVEAHLILNLFQHAGLSGRIDGEFLQGGIGELQVAGTVRVMITKADYEQGKEIIMQWEAKETIEIKNNPAIKKLRNKPNNLYFTIKWKYFIFITIVFLFVSILLYTIPIINSGCFTGARPISWINKTTIIGTAEELHDLLSIEFSNKNNKILGTHLDQTGLIDGKERVIDFVNNGETGVALAHLTYMIDALEKSNIKVPVEVYKKVKNMRKELVKKVKNNN